MQSQWAKVLYFIHPPKVTKTKIFLEHVIHFQPCTVSSQLRDDQRSKDASLNFKKNVCILFCYNPISHSECYASAACQKNYMQWKHPFSEPILILYLVMALWLQNIFSHGNRFTNLQILIKFHIHLPLTTSA